MPDDQDTVAMSSELPPPTEPKRKDKKWRTHPRKGALTKRGPPRPYKRLPEETLQLRIQIWCMPRKLLLEDRDDLFRLVQIQASD